MPENSALPVASVTLPCPTAIGFELSRNVTKEKPRSKNCTKREKRSAVWAKWLNQSRPCLSALRRRLDAYVACVIVPISKIKVRQDEDGVFIAKCLLLPGCHADGQDRGEAILHFQEAAKAHLEALLETGRPIPPAFRDKFVLVA